jgi:hypothetical protein
MNYIEWMVKVSDACMAGADLNRNADCAKFVLKLGLKMCQAAGLSPHQTALELAAAELGK